MPLHIIIGAQWGDEGKGRITDLLAADAHIVARYSGGDNAGHTVTVSGPGGQGQRIFKLLGEQKGKDSVSRHGGIGSSIAADPGGGRRQRRTTSRAGQCWSRRGCCIQSPVTSLLLWISRA